MPLISIITTTYKHQLYILETIKSIQSQDFQDRELLIGDDSPDNLTQDIIAPIIKWDTRIHYRHHSPNKGIVGNTNFLLQQISSDAKYVAFLEGDDLYTKDNLSTKLKIFKEYPKVKLVYSDLDFINKQWKTLISKYLRHRKIPLFQNKTIPSDIFIKQTTGPITTRSTCMIESSILSTCQVRSLENDKKNYQVSDYDFYFQVATQYPVYGIAEPLTKYRRHENNLSWSNGGTSEDLDKLITYYHQNKLIDEATYTDKMSRIHIVHAFFAFEIGKKWAWLKYLIKSRKYKKTSYLPYKIFLGLMLIVPSFVWKKIIKKVVGRH